VRWSADQVLRRILPEQSIKGDFHEASGRLILGEVQLDDGWVGRELTEIEAASSTRVAYLTRFGEGILPGPGTRYQKGDIVHAMMSVDSTFEIDRILSKPPVEESE
jgi:trk system potassium uptake protein